MSEWFIFAALTALLTPCILVIAYWTWVVITYNRELPERLKDERERVAGADSKKK